MHITTKISSIHDGNNKRAYSIFRPLHLKKNAAAATAIICATYGENVVSHITCKRWHQKFCRRNFSLKDEPRAGRLQKIETDELQALLDINSAQTEKLAEQLSVTQQAISVCLHTMRKVQKEGRWVLHELSGDNKNRWRDTAFTLFSKFRQNDFLHKIITGDEKCILYDNPKRRKSWHDLRHRCQSPISTPRRFFSVSDGIGKVCSMMSCYKRVKQSQQIATNNN